MSESNSSFLLSRQAFGRKNCGLIGRHFFTLMEPNGPSNKPPAGRKWPAVYLLEDRDRCRQVPRNARFDGMALGQAFLDLQAALVVQFELNGGPRLGAPYRDELHMAAVAELLLTKGDSAVVKTTPDRLSYWIEIFEMFPPRRCKLLLTDASGVSEIARLVAA